MYPENTLARATVRGVPDVVVLRRRTASRTTKGPSDAPDAYLHDWAHTNVAGYTCSNDDEVTNIEPLTLHAAIVGERFEVGGDLRCATLDPLVAMARLDRERRDAGKAPLTWESLEWGVEAVAEGLRYEVRPIRVMGLRS